MFKIFSFTFEIITFHELKVQALSLDRKIELMEKVEPLYIVV